MTALYCHAILCGMSNRKALTLAAPTAIAVLGAVLIALGIGQAHPGHVIHPVHSAVYHLKPAPVRNV